MSQFNTVDMLNQEARRTNYIPWVLATLVFFSVSVGSSEAWAKTYYVATTGNDDTSNSGTLRDKPFRTIQRAANVVAAGDTVKIFGGRYPAFALNRVRGTSNAPIIFEPASSARVIVDRHLGGGNGLRAIELSSCSYIIVDGLEVTDSDPLIDKHKNCDVINQLETCGSTQRQFRFTSRNGIKINSSTESPSHHITLQNLTVFHNGSQAILGRGHNFRILNNHIHSNGAIGEGYGMYIVGDKHIIRGNRSHDNNGPGIRTGTDGGASGYLTNSVIEENQIYDNIRPYVHYRNFTEPVLIRYGGMGIVLWHGHNNIIRNNLIYNNGNTGIWLNGDSPFKNQVYNNTIYGNRRGGVYIYHDGEANIVRNNIIVANGTRYGALTLKNGNNIASHNILSGVGGFVNAKAFDFRLRPDSPARDKGMSLQAVAVDFLGVARPQGPAYDIGAYEFSTAAPPVSAVCGQNGCEAGETCENCAQDCGPCSVSQEVTAMGIAGSITVDGELNDCSWSEATWKAFSNTGRSDNTVEFATLWDADNLYLGFKVVDAQLESDSSTFWQNDGVELYFDVLHNATTSLDDDDWRVIVDIAGRSTQSTIRNGVVSTPTGYTMELEIPWSTLNSTPEASKTLGLLVGNNDRDMGTSVQYDWNGLIDSGSYSRPNLWGDLRLLAPTGEICDDTLGNGNDCDGAVNNQDSDCSVTPPSSCAEVTVCDDNDGCCPEDCIGSDLDCSVTGTVSCTDDGEGGKTCAVVGVTGCNTMSRASWIVLLLGMLGFSTIARRRYGKSN